MVAGCPAHIGVRAATTVMLAVPSAVAGELLASLIVYVNESAPE
jgi:hypothetical protein